MSVGYGTTSAYIHTHRDTALHCTTLITHTLIPLNFTICAAYDEAIALDPTAVLFHSNKAAVYIEMGECDRAVEICENAVQLGRTQRTPYLDIAKLYQRMAAAQLKKDDFPAAKESFAKAQMEHFDKAIERKVCHTFLPLVHCGGVVPHPVCMSMSQDNLSPFLSLVVFCSCTGEEHGVGLEQEAAPGLH